MDIKSIIKDSLILFAITLILGAVLSGAKVGTQPLVDKAAKDSQIKAFNKVCEGYDSYDNITSDLVGASAGIDNASFTSEEGFLRAKDASGNPIGYIAQVTSKGYGGDLNLIIGFNLNGDITGVQYANTPSETPGLGMKTTKESFLKSWEGHNNDDVESVDTISGATISSTAFKQAMRYACMFAERATTMYGGVK